MDETEALLGSSNLVAPTGSNVQTVPSNLAAIDERRAVTGDGSIAYRFASGTRVWAHVGNSFRAPSLYERFSNVGEACPA